MDINWRFVRSVFCDMKRTILYEGGQKECRHVKNVQTPWLNVDGILGIVPIGGPARVSCEPFGKVDKDGVPTASVDPFGTHAGQTVRLGVCSLAPRDYEPGQEIFTASVAFVTDVNAAETRRLVEACREQSAGEGPRVYRVRGQDGQEYVVVTNFADAEADVAIAGAAAARVLTPKAVLATTKAGKDIQLRLVPRGCALLAR